MFKNAKKLCQIGGVFCVILEKILALDSRLWYHISAFRMAVDALSVPGRENAGLAEGRKQPEAELN